jgi:hypothetical protein
MKKYIFATGETVETHIQIKAEPKMDKVVTPDDVLFTQQSADTQQEKPKHKLFNMNKKNKKKDNRVPYDYNVDVAKPNTFNFDFQPKIIKPIFDAVRDGSVRTPNDTIIASIISTMTEKFSFYRVGTTFPFKNKVITSNMYSITYTKSGAGKDLSASVTNDIFSEFDKEIYNTISWAAKRYEKDVDRVIALQDPNDKEKIDALKASKFLSHKSYVQTESTDEGIIENMRTFMKIGVGSITWRVQEMGDMLLKNSEGSLSMKLVKELYDSSSLHNKQIKSASQSSVSGVPFNVIGYTSPQGLFDDGNKNKIKKEMSRGNVRRFHSIMPTQKEYPKLEVKDMSKQERLEKLKANKQGLLSMASYKSRFENIAKQLQQPLYENVEMKYQELSDLRTPGLTHFSRAIGKVYEWSDEAAIYFDEYEEKINYRWATSKNGDDESVSDLAYKVIKLLPIYCILNDSNQITELEVRQAIYLVEYFHSHTQNLKALMDENTTVEIEDNKIYEFLKANIGEYFTISKIKSDARLTKDKERDARYLDAAIELLNDDEDYEFDTIEEVLRGKTYIKYGLIEIEDIDLEDMEDDDED